MFRPMARAARALPEEEMQAILAGGEYGVLSTIGEDGYPYGAPLNYVMMDGKLYVHFASAPGHLLENLGSCARVCFTIVGKTEVMPEKFGTKYESVIVFGTAAPVDDACKQAALEKFLEKYSSPACLERGLKYIEGAFQNTAVYAISMEHVTGKARKI